MHMQRQRRVLRFSAVLVLVVLALTGFSTGRGRGHHYKSGHGGGGCSSSHQDHDETSSSYRRSYGSSSGTTSSGSYGSSAGASPSGRSHRDDATVRLLSCATKPDPYTKVEVTNPNATGATFSVTVRLKDRDGGSVGFADLDVTVPAHGSRTARIPVDKADLARLDHCEPRPDAPATR
ncbi:hypothetical protein [Streptomyces collinus]|uniref:hypothetical protein n=1 Tax=Streptomyces collinus TaxID=42684 RepID=UPI0029431B6F|nr:hypothetical protein [Streptomyces collinus]